MGKDKWVAISIVVFLLAALAAARFNMSSDVEEAEAQAAIIAAAPPIASISKPPPILGDSVELSGIQGWQQVQQGDEDKLGPRPYEGQVRIVWFWTFACHNCKATIPFLSGIYDRWHDRGLEVIGVHSPEFAFEEDPTAISEASKELGVTWPVALDTNATSFFKWQGNQGYWPRTYVLDQQGQIRFDDPGESAFKGNELEETVAYLIENGSQPAAPAPAN